MTHSEHPVHQWRHKIFVYYLTFMALAFLLPLPTTPLAESKHVDKPVYFGIFLGLLCSLTSIATRECGGRF
jgi:hypothetical protein